MDGRVEFRRAVAADAGRVRALVRDAYAGWVPLLGREPGPMGADYDAAIRHHRIDLLAIDGDLVGLIELVLGDDHLLIETVAVRIDRQRLGLGGRLLAHAETVAASEGREIVRLYTNALMSGNVRFYRGLGYRIDGARPFAGGTRIDMSKAVGIRRERASVSACGPTSRS